MIIRLRHYEQGYHIASYAVCEETAEKMRELGYHVVLRKNQMLYFLPENWQIPLEEEEARCFDGTPEYSIFEFNPPDRDHAKAYGSAYLYLNPDSSDHTLFLTNRCNSSCIMCPVSDQMRKTSEITSLEHLLWICRQMPEAVQHITITGGEPFLLKTDIFPLLSWLKQNRPQTEYLLLTNGRIFSSTEYARRFCESVPKQILVGIPVHGYDAKTHDAITRTEGSFVQTIHGIKNLLALQIPVEIRIVVSRLNMDFLDKIAELIVRELRGVHVVKFMGLEMLGNAWHNRERVWVSYSDSAKYMEGAVRYLVTNGVDVGIYNYPLCCVDSGLWPLCKKSITDYKVRYLPVCEDCTKKDACGGMFSGTVRMMDGSIAPFLR